MANVHGSISIECPVVRGFKRLSSRHDEDRIVYIVAAYHYVLYYGDTILWQTKNVQTLYSNLKAGMAQRMPLVS